MLLALALIALLYLMAADRRSVADYGLVVNKNWTRHAVAGLLMGATFYGAYCAAAWWLGVFHVDTEHVTPVRCGKALLAMMAAIPVAALQQIIFSGYLPSKLRDRVGRLPSILLPALLFGIFGGWALREGLFSPAGGRLAVGMFFIAALLCTVRLILGNLALPAGLLAGAIMVRRIIKKTYLLEFDSESPWSDWLAPVADPRQGPVMWCLLAATLIAALVALWRRGEYRLPADQPALDASFKRVMPFSNLLGLAPLDLWLAKLWQARFRVGLKYLPRLAVTLIASGANTILCLPERLLAPLLLRHIVPDPVFIVGVHRSGTTHLHNLLSLDGRFCTPRNYQVFNPHGFLTGWLTTLVLGPFLTWRRPMDSVQLTAFSPQEEEFAVAAMTPYSPYWLACFPTLFAAHERFIYPNRMNARERAHWQRQLVLFLRKVTFFSRKSPLLKSPYNTARVAALRRMFPRAKFIHIVRHPHAVYRSNMHLAEHGWAVFQLQDAGGGETFASRLLDNYYDQERAFYDAAQQLPADDVAEVRFEDLEQDPLGEVRRVYDQLKLEFTPELQRRLENYLASIAGYKKNRFARLPGDQRQEIDAKMGDFAARWGYDTDSPPSGKRAA